MENIKNVIIADTHFGVKNREFFEYQMKYFYEEFIPKCKELISNGIELNLIHCGDLFDNRSTISIYIASKVNRLFKELSKLFKEIIIIGGNHDYLAQNSDDNYRINSINEILINEYNIIKVTEKPLCRNGIGYIDFYSWNVDNVKYVINQGVKSIVTHIDISQLESDINELIKSNDISLISGHIHIPSFGESKFNLGSCFYINSLDTDFRQSYVFDYHCNKIEGVIKNTKSLRFYKFFDKDVIELSNNLHKYNDLDRIEIYLPADKILNLTYSEEIGKINTYFKYVNINPINETNENEIDNEIINFEDFSIEDIIENDIPEDYKETFYKIINKYKNG